VFVSGKPLETL